MYPNDALVVVIATSKKRTELLKTLSLRSIYTQINVNPLEVVVVDDNPIQKGESYSSEYNKIKASISALRKEVLYNTYKNYINEKRKCSFDQFFPTTLLKNNRTHAHSGTGAWNTAIFYLINKYKKKKIFVSILDDDDEYVQNYLSTCMELIIGNEDKLAAVFPQIMWVEKDSSWICKLTLEKLTQREFFIGNPGIQGSNMCIRLDVLEAIGGFDENLHSATDRDLMIRFLDYLEEVNSKSQKPLIIEIIPKPMVMHNAYFQDRVTTDKKLKKLGLDSFYSKYIGKFSNDDFKESIDRAKRLFEYECTE